MDLDRHVEELHRQLVVAAEAGGDDATRLAERLTAPLDSAVRLTLLDVLGEAAVEITSELAPGSVEVRLRGRHPELVVTLPPPPDEAAVPSAVPSPSPAADERTDDAAMTRINLRLPDHLKARVERAAEAEGLSTNAWLVRAATAALDGPAVGPARRAPRGGDRLQGWAR